MNEEKNKMIGLYIYKEILGDIIEFQAEEQFNKSLQFFKAVQEYSDICYSDNTLYTTINNISLEEILLNVFYEFQETINYSFYYYYDEINADWTHIIDGCCYKLERNIEDISKMKYPLAELEKIQELLKEGITKTRDELYYFCLNWNELNLEMTSTMKEEILEKIEEN